MYIPVNETLRKFSTLVAANLQAGDDTVVRKSGLDGVGVGKTLAGRFARAFHLGKDAKADRAANNEVRSMFLNAVIKEFGGIQNVPKSVLSALKIHDFSFSEDEYGTASCSSGRPLTMRRIKAVLSAMDDVKVRLQLLERGGVGFNHEAEACVRKLGGAFVTGDGTGELTPLGYQVGRLADHVTKLVYDGLTDDKARVDFLTNPGPKVLDVARRIGALALELESQVSELLDKAPNGDLKGTFAAFVMRPDSNGNYPSDVLQNIRRRFLPRCIATQLISWGTSQGRFNGAGIPADCKTLDDVLSWIRTLLKKPDGSPTELVEKTARDFDIGAYGDLGVGNGVRFHLNTLREIEKKFDISFDAETREMFVYRQKRQEEEFTPWDRSCHVTMFESCLKACGGDKDSAMRLFHSLLPLNRLFTAKSPEGMCGIGNVETGGMAEATRLVEIITVPNFLDGAQRREDRLRLLLDKVAAGAALMKPEFAEKRRGEVIRLMVQQLAFRRADVASLLRNVPDDVLGRLLQSDQNRLGGADVPLAQLSRDVVKVFCDVRNALNG